MTMYLCDTNIISEAMRPKPNDSVRRWLEAHVPIIISTVTIEEIYYGLGYKSASAQEKWFAEFLQLHCDVIPVTDEIAKQAGQWRGQFRKQGLIRSQADMLIAATAYLHDLALVTRNSKDFQGCDIAIFNPFE